jgi:hypothetical protein
MYVGTRRRESDSRLLVRLTENVEVRDTLVPCHACDGSGNKVIEYKDGSYRQLPCPWCMSGYMDKATAKMYARWKNIRRVNKCPS